MPKLNEDQKIIRYQVCPECGGRLCGWYDAIARQTYVVCKDNQQHRGIARKYEPASPESDYGNWRSEMVIRIGEAKTNKLERYYGATALSPIDLQKIIETLWPKAPPVERYKALMLCRQYGLNPLRRQVHIMSFDRYVGKGTDRKKTGEKDYITVLGIQANRQIVYQSGPPYSYLDNTPRAMTKDEEILINGEADAANLWSITKLQDKDSMTAQGTGCWPRNKVVQGADKGNTPRHMADIHSERQALDRLRPGVSPQNVEVLDEAYIPKAEVVDQQTGEITGEPPEDDGEADLFPEDQSLKMKRDPATVKSIADLYQACKDDFGIKTKEEVLADLNYNAAAEIIDPAECYTRIWAIRKG